MTDTHRSRPGEAVPVSRRALRESRAQETVRPASRALSLWDIGYFVVEMGVYSGVSVAALRLVNGAWSDLSALGLLAAAVAIVAMAVVWGLWAAEHAVHRTAGSGRAILEYGWMALGVAGWLVAGLPAIGIPLAGLIMALIVRRMYGVR